jgi:HAD superfamily hydrolase (TIGR01490 family)
MLKGLSKSEALSLFTEAAQTTVDTAREETLGILRWHQEEGHTVILMSGGFQPFLQVVGNLLGINYTVGTELEEVDDYYTGRLAGSFCHGDDRVRLVRHFIESSGFNVNLSSSYAYGDRVHDIPTMEMVGHPVAVYPDKELFTYAKEKGWTVIGDSAA